MLVCEACEMYIVAIDLADRVARGATGQWGAHLQALGVGELLRHISSRKGGDAGGLPPDAPASPSPPVAPSSAAMTTMWMRS